MFLSELADALIPDEYTLIRSNIIHVLSDSIKSMNSVLYNINTNILFAQTQLRKLAKGPIYALNKSIVLISYQYERYTCIIIFHIHMRGK